MSLTLARPPLFTIRFLDTRLVQADEIWSFVYAKAKNVPEDKRDTFGYGDVWTWTALDAESKLMISWLLGEWTAEAARDFMADVASRLVLRPQIVTDANRAAASVAWQADDSRDGGRDQRSRLDVRRDCGTAGLAAVTFGGCSPATPHAIVASRERANRLAYRTQPPKRLGHACATRRDPHRSRNRIGRKRRTHDLRLAWPSIRSADPA